jgi:hypothetical protein
VIEGQEVGNGGNARESAFVDPGGVVRWPETFTNCLGKKLVNQNSIKLYLSIVSFLVLK